MSTAFNSRRRRAMFAICLLAAGAGCGREHRTRFLVNGLRGDESLAQLVESKPPLACDGRIEQGDQAISSGEQLDSLAGVEVVEGDLVIIGDASNVSALGCLREVGGRLIFGDLPELDVLDLPSLTSVGDSLEVARCDVLQTIRINALNTVGSQASLIAVGLPLLRELEADALTEISEDLLLQDIGEATGETLKISVRSLRAIDGSLIIERVANLEDLNGFSEQMQRVGRVALASNSQLHSVSGLGSVSDVLECAVVDNLKLSVCDVEQDLSCAQLVVEDNLDDLCVED